MHKALAINDDQTVFELVATDNKDIESRLRTYIDWLKTEHIPWNRPDLASYRDELLKRGLAPSTVASHLSTIRAAYRRLLAHNRIRDALYETTPTGANPADRKAYVDELIQRIQNGIDPLHSSVSVTQYQDVDESQYLRLTDVQAGTFLSSPGTDTLRGLRDTAIIATLLCTGIREGELVALQKRDLRASLGGETALNVRQGKGNKARLVPYGDMVWCLSIIDRWLQQARIEGGAIFRGFYRGAEKVRPYALTTRAIEYILAAYPIMIDNELVSVKPHDCRRTYARRLYDAGMDLVAIQQNLGHAHIRTTLHYIGSLDADSRRGRSIYSIDPSSLL